MLTRLRAAAGWRVLIFAVPLVLGTAAAAAAAVFYAAPAASAAGPEPQADAEVPAPAVPGLLVDVTGAVVHPGLYRLHRGDRVYAAIAAAGGLGPDADRSRLPNLAGSLRDGQQVRVPSTHGGGRGGSATALDLNAASAEELAAVPGFSPDLAAAAVAYRTRFGGFRSPRELVTQLGMGEAEFTRARRFVRA